MLSSRDIKFYKGLLYWLFSIEIIIRSLLIEKFLSKVVINASKICNRQLSCTSYDALSTFDTFSCTISGCGTLFYPSGGNFCRFEKISWKK
jgi:hypothetical protein